MLYYKFFICNLLFLLFLLFFRKAHWLRQSPQCRNWQQRFWIGCFGRGLHNRALVGAYLQSERPWQPWRVKLVGLIFAWRVIIITFSSAEKDGRQADRNNQIGCQWFKALLLLLHQGCSFRQHWCIGCQHSLHSKTYQIHFFTWKFFFRLKRIISLFFSFSIFCLPQKKTL